MTEDVKIEQDAYWEIVDDCEHPCVIDSGAMSPCVSVFIYDAESKATYCCHYSSPDVHQSDDLIDMIDSALIDFNTSNDIKVFVTGAVLSEKGSIKKRNYIENLLDSKLAASAEIKYLWPEKGVDSVELILEPSTGKLLEPKT